MADFVDRASEKLQKLSDEQLGRIFSSMHEETQVFDSIIQSIPLGLIIVDGGWRCRMINKAARRYLNFVSRRMPGRARNESGARGEAAVWELISDSEVANFIKSCAQTQNTNTSKEFSVVSADDKARFITVSVLPLVRQREISGMMIYIEDVSAKREQEILSWRMESLKSLTNLAASVAHEIKNPLGAISIHVQLLQKSIQRARESGGALPDAEHTEHYIDVVNEEIENLNRIVMDFLFAARPVKASLTLSKPSDIISKATVFFAPDFEKSNIALSLNLKDEGTRLLIDEKLFREVLVNLFQNAKSAIASARREDGMVSVGAFVKGGQYVMTVADNGCGMTDEQCGAIFEPYYTTKADGTGLGLTTVYKIIKEFHGEISVTSKVGQGTVFTIQIPVPQSEVKLLESK